MEERLKAIEKRLELLETPLTSSGEKLSRCVQCGETYRESRNPDGVCEFHLEAVGDSWSRTPGKYLCCQQPASSTKGCQRKAHVNAHHDRYPYHAYRTWFWETLTRAEEVWVDLERIDLASEGGDDNTTARTQIGVLNDGTSLFVRAGSKLKVFEDFHLPSPSQPLSGIGGITTTVLCEDKCGAEGYVRVVLESKASLTVSAKSTSDSLPEVVTIELESGADNKLFPKTIEYAENTRRKIQQVAQEVNVLAQGRTRAGPELDVKDPPTPQKYEQESSNVDKFVQLSVDAPLEVGTSWSSDNGSFTQYVSGHLIVLNPTDKAMLIADVWAEYFDPTTSAWIRSTQSSESAVVGVRVDAASSFRSRIPCAIRVTGVPGDDNESRARLHSSLPCPLCVRFNVDFADGGKLSIKAESVNKKLVLPSKEGLEKSYGGKIIHWDQCDNFNLFVRHYVYVYRDDEGAYLIRSSVASSNVFTLTPSRLARIGYRAMIAGETLRVLDEMSSSCDSETTSFSCSALVSDGRVIALQFKLKTATGHSESFLKLENVDESSPSAKLEIVTTDPIRPNQLITVKWSNCMETKADSTWLGVFKRFAPKNCETYIGETVSTKGSREGTTNIRLPLQKGMYEIRLVCKGELKAKTSQIAF